MVSHGGKDTTKAEYEGLVATSIRPRLQGGMDVTKVPDLFKLSRKWHASCATSFLPLHLIHLLFFKFELTWAEGWG